MADGSQPLAPPRPALRYLGGKWRLAPWIIRHFPRHLVYVEPFGGAASVLLRKPKSYAEVYNDLDGELVNFFQVLRDPEMAAELVRLVTLTPFAREEWELAHLPAEMRVERARRLCVRSYMGHGSNASNLGRNTGFRSNTHRRSTTPSLDWATYPPALAAVAERIQSGVRIERRPALQVIANCDGPETLIYADPPYVHDTRSRKRKKDALHNGYAHELTDDEHAELLAALLAVRGMVVLSGYPHPIYDDRLKHWKRVERLAHADGARKRTEVLWINPAAQAGLCDLFEGAR